MDPTAVNTGKKQRGSSENIQSFETATSSNAQAIATIEPYSSSQTPDGQESPDNQEIILDDDTNGASGSHESDYVLIGDGQQNVLSSTSGQINEDNQLEDYENSQPEEDVILDEEDETIEQDNQEQEEGGNEEEGDEDDLQLEMANEEETNENSNNQMDNGRLKKCFVN